MDTLASIITQHLNQNRKELNSNKYRVSDAGRCHKMRYWRRAGLPASDPPDERLQRVFEVGHIFHGWLQSVLESNGVLLHKEYEVEDRHRIGHVDAIVKVDGRTILYDFKTVHSRKFHHNRREGNAGDIHYQLQACTYAEMLPMAVNDIRIAYISKDDLCIEELSVNLLRGMIENDWKPLYEAWEKREEPKANPMEWECRLCSYKSVCPTPTPEMKGIKGGKR